MILRVLREEVTARLSEGIPGAITLKKEFKHGK